MSCFLSCVSSGEKLDDEVAKAVREKDKERKRLNKVIEDGMKPFRLAYKMCYLNNKLNSLESEN